MLRPYLATFLVALLFYVVPIAVMAACIHLGWYVA